MELSKIDDMAKGEIGGSPRTFSPGPAPWSAVDTGLSPSHLLDLMIKVFYTSGLEELEQVADALCLEIGVLQDIIPRAKDQRLVEARGIASPSQRMRYALTDQGRDWARAAIARDAYVGPAPVAFDRFVAQIEAQTIAHERIDRASLEEAFSDLVVPPNFLRRIGPAVNSARAILLYGPPGNGKTATALQVGAIFQDVIAVPHAVDFGGEIVRVFDPVVHEPVEDVPGDRPYPRPDRRWVPCRRPRIVVGGELTLDMVELRYRPDAGYYEAPLQMKASGGLFLIDDLGRQRVRAEDLLNRWIVPMEKHVDYFNTNSGKTFAVPFDNLLVFSTNMTPQSLMDAAFLRRIAYKIEVPYPSEAEYAEVFRKIADREGLEIPKAFVDRLIHVLTVQHGAPLSFYQPPFVVDQVIGACRFDGTEPAFTLDRIDEAVDNLIATPDQTEAPVAAP